MVHLLPQAAAALLRRAHVAVLGRETALEEPGAVLGPEARLLVRGLDDEDEGRLADGCERLLDDNVQRGLDDEADVEALLAEAEDGVPGAVGHLAVSDDVAGLEVCQQ